MLSEIDILEDYNSIIREIGKCRDPKYFIENYLNLNMSHGIIPFKLNKIQDDVINHYKKHDFIIIHKKRQIGITSILDALTLHNILFGIYGINDFPFIKGALISDCSNIKIYYDNLPSWLKNMAKCKITKKYIYTPTKEFIFRKRLSEGFGRGHNYNIFYIDESTLIYKIEDFINSQERIFKYRDYQIEHFNNYYPVKSIITGNHYYGKYDNWFRELFNESVEGKTRYKALLYS